MRFRTRAVHAGLGTTPEHGDVMPPVHVSSTYAFAAPDTARPFDYARSGNPSRTSLEQALAALESAMHAHAFASGMAAIAMTLELVRPGERILVSDECYGGTWRLLYQVCAPRGVKVDAVDAADLDAIEGALAASPTRLVWLESPTNPLMKVVDLAAIAERARGAGALCACDNTFLSPYFQNPLDLGLDLVVHSSTKYINGHSDVIGGAVCTNDSELSARLGFLQNAIGAVPSPWDCFLTQRGIKTLALRMEAHQVNALALAQLLEAHPKIERVLYPGLASHPQHALSVRQTRGHGGVFSFWVKGGVEDAHRLLGALRHFVQAVSLGGVESLIEHPWSMTHLAIPEPERAAMGIAPNLIRVSAGVEDPADLCEDFEQALTTL